MKPTPAYTAVYLTFASQAEADEALADFTFPARDDVGELRERDTRPAPKDMAELAARLPTAKLTGWHVNLLLEADKLPAALRRFRTHPSDPQRRWAGH